MRIPPYSGLLLLNGSVAIFSSKTTFLINSLPKKDNSRSSGSFDCILKFSDYGINYRLFFLAWFLPKRWYLYYPSIECESRPNFFETATIKERFKGREEYKSSRCRVPMECAGSKESARLRSGDESWPRYQMKPPETIRRFLFKPTTLYKKSPRENAQVRVGL
jgi:hypothetical protein